MERCVEAYSSQSLFVQEVGETNVGLQKKRDSKQNKKECRETPCCRLKPKSLQGFNGMLMWLHGRKKSVEGYLVFITVLCLQMSWVSYVCSVFLRSCPSISFWFLLPN